MYNEFIKAVLLIPNLFKRKSAEIEIRIPHRAKHLIYIFC